ncbi:VOC family protein [Rhizobium sp. RCC_161_2]|uniref:VOC family protein n=1 Tax=Rhizobium sp. RCC_161_2 TaxID=3239219 RepID=UPI003525AE9E
MKMRQHLWFRRDMESAIELYTSLIPNSSIGWVSNIPADNPNGPAGSVKVAGITLGNRSYMAFEAGPLAPFDHDSSITVSCETQAEFERLYDILKKGASTEQGGILQDRWGLRWKILPKQLGDRVPATVKTEQLGEDQLHKAKFDIAELEAAAKG